MCYDYKMYDSGGGNIYTELQSLTGFFGKNPLFRTIYWSIFLSENGQFWQK